VQLRAALADLQGELADRLSVDADQASRGAAADAVSEGVKREAAN
jgi:hypothetical protein